MCANLGLSYLHNLTTLWFRFAPERRSAVCRGLIGTLLSALC
jgi:hypothetical protein